MSFSIATITGYVEQNKLPLITQTVFDAKTQSLLQKRVGIKSQEALNIMDTDAVFQDATACAWNADGTTTFSQRTITVARVKVQEVVMQTLRDVMTVGDMVVNQRAAEMPMSEPMGAPI